jgi:hypothetical protein
MALDRFIYKYKYKYSYIQKGPKPLENWTIRHSAFRQELNPKFDHSPVFRWSLCPEFECPVFRSPLYSGIPMVALF